MLVTTLATAEALALSHMNKHGLLDAGWTFKFDRAKRRLGQCNYTDKCISLSTHWVEVLGVAEIEDTILHEIAHVLAGYRAKHGYAWQAHARRLGARPTACAPVQVEIAEKPPLIGTCPTCKVTIKRYRRPSSPRWCARHAGFHASTMFTWELNGEPLQHSTQYLQHVKLSEAY